MGRCAKPTSLSLRLPVETCEFVIDHIGGETGSPKDDPCRMALQRCALVCRSWRPRAQMWIFHEIAPETLESVDRLAAVLAASPALALHVRRLRLFCGSSVYRLYSSRKVAKLLSLAVSGRFSSLQYVYVSGFGVPEQPHHDKDSKLLPHLPLHPTFLHLCTSFSTVTELFVDGVMFANFADLARFLSRFKSLKTLQCHDVQWSAEGLTPGFAAPKWNLNSRSAFESIRVLEVG